MTMISTKAPPEPAQLSRPVLAQMPVPSRWLPVLQSVLPPLLVLKLNAFAKRPGGKKAKDAYDLLVAVSSYSEGPAAAIAAFHTEAASDNPAFETAAQTLKWHFTQPNLDGPIQASLFRYGQNDSGSEGMRLKEDLVTIAHALLDFE